jgi:hypothetical protein
MIGNGQGRRSRFVIYNREVSTQLGHDRAVGRQSVSASVKMFSSL